MSAVPVEIQIESLSLLLKSWMRIHCKQLCTIVNASCTLELGLLCNMMP